MNANRFLHAFMLSAVLSTSLTCHATVSEKTLKTKDFYIGRINENAKDVFNLERIVTAGLALQGLILAGPLGLAASALGSAIMLLGSLAGGSQLIAVFTAVDRLEKMIKKEPDLYIAMSKDDKKTFNTGKSLVSGKLLSLIYEHNATEAALKKAAEEFVQQHPSLITTTNTQATAVKNVGNYLNWTTDIKLYDYARAKEKEARDNIKLGILTPLINKALTFGDKLFAEPIIKAKITQKTKSLDSLRKKQPELAALEPALQASAQSLFDQLVEIKQKYERSEKNLTPEQKAR